MMSIEIFNAKQIHLTDEEIKSIVEIECNPRVQEWLYEYSILDIEKEFLDYKKFFRKLPKKKEVDILVARCNGRIVGFLGLWRLGTYMEHVATIGISVHPNYWRKGVATKLIKSAIKLAQEKKLRRLEVETLSENAPMRLLIEKLGFKLESLRKNRIKKGESYLHEAVYYMLL